MRIKKPNKAQDYLMFASITERDAEKDKLKNGQEVKIADASGDEGINSGWAIYKYDKKTDVFDLLEKEEQLEVETINLSKNTSSLTSVDNYIDLESTHTFKKDWKLMQDFDLNFLGDIFVYVRAGTENSDFKELPISTPDGMKYLNIHFWSFNATLYTQANVGDLVNYHVMATVYDSLQGIGKGTQGMFNPSGLPLDMGLTESNMVCIATIQAKRPANGSAFDYDKMKVFKHWKKALAPAEERIPIPEMPEIPSVDGKTIALTPNLGGNHLISPEHQKPYQGDMKIMQDFTYDLVVNEDAKTIELRPNGGLSTIQIPIETSTGLRYIHISAHTIRYADISGGATGNTMYWALTAPISDSQNPIGESMQRLSNSDGSPILMFTKDHNFYNRMPILQIRFKRPLSSTWKWYAKDVEVYSYWKTILAPAEERIVIPESSGYNLDKETLFETTLSEKTTIFAPALMQPHPVNFFLLEDFDLEFSIGKTVTGNKAFLRVAPIGGNRQLPIKIDGIRKYMSIVNESVIMPDLFGGDFGGKWKYFVLDAVIDDAEGAVKPHGTEYESSGAAMHVQAYPNSTKFKFVQIGVKFNPDETLDYKNVKVFKYWKNCLAPFNELWTEKVTP